MVAFLFPGQGAQHPGMAGDFYAASAGVRKLFEEASQILGTDMKKLIDESDAETLKRTDVAQPALTLANLAAAEFLAGRGVLPGAVAGHSLGEYAALVVSGVISRQTCFLLVKARGAAMQKAAERCEEGSGMAAVLGLPPADVERLVSEWTAAGLEGLYAANLNSPRQTVVSGTARALAEAEGRFKEAGARRVVRLQVAGPFHSPLMRAAADEFSETLAGADFADPSVPFFSNVSGAAVTSGAEIKALAARHIIAPVRWTDEEAALAALAPEAVTETGPGAVLAGLWKDFGSAIPLRPLNQ